MVASARARYEFVDLSGVTHQIDADHFNCEGDEVVFYENCVVAGSKALREVGRFPNVAPRSILNVIPKRSARPGKEP